MKAFILVLMLSLSFVITGCDSKKEPKSVAYYVDHPEERRAVLKECADNPGQHKDDPDCINAKAASHQDSWGNPEDFRIK